MAKLPIPVYKPSGAGGIQDLKNINKAVAISWGGYRSKLLRMYKKVAQTTTLANGIEVFNPVSIKNWVGLPGSDVYEFLILWGFTKEQLAEYTIDFANPDYDIQDVVLTFSYDPKLSEESFEAMMDAYWALANGVDELTVQVMFNAYEINTPDVDIINSAPGIKDIGLDYGIAKFVYGNVNPNIESYEHQGNGLKIRTNYPENGVQVDLSSAGINIPITNEVKSGLMVIMANEPGIIMTDIGVPIITIINVDGVDYKQVSKVQKAEFTSAGLHNIKQQYHWFHVKYGDVKDCEGQSEETCDNDIAAQNATHPTWWGFFKPDDGQVEKNTDGLIVQVHEKFLAMSVKGLEETRSDVFGFYCSQYLELNVQTKKPGTFGRIIGSFMKAITSLVNAVVELFLKIPILKQLTELVLSTLGKVFGVDAIGARAILSAIIIAVLIIIFVIYFPPMAAMFQTVGTAIGTATGIGSGVSVGVASAMTMLSYANTAFSIYNSAMSAKLAYVQEENEIEKADMEYKRKLAIEANPITEAYSGTMGTTDDKENADNLMFDKMFNPYFGFEQAVPAIVINSDKI